MIQKINLAKFKSSNISKTEVTTPTKFLHMHIPSTSTCMKFLSQFNFFTKMAWSNRKIWPILKVAISPKPERPCLPKMVCMHLTSNSMTSHSMQHNDDRKSIMMTIHNHIIIMMIIQIPTLTISAVVQALKTRALFYSYFHLRIHKSKIKAVGKIADSIIVKRQIMAGFILANGKKIVKFTKSNPFQNFICYTMHSLNMIFGQNSKDDSDGQNDKIQQTNIVEKQKIEQFSGQNIIIVAVRLR